MKKIILSTMMYFVAVASIAQSINGRVIDEQTQPMAFANVVLLNRSDSTFITGEVTKADGTFYIATDRKDGLLKVSSVGYETRYLDARQGNVSDIVMLSNIQELGEVEVNERTENELKAIYDRTFGRGGDRNLTEENLYSSNFRIVADVVRALDRAAGYQWSFGSHSGSPVGLYVTGACAEQFNTVKDNAEIAPLIAKLAGYKK